MVRHYRVKYCQWRGKNLDLIWEMDKEIYWIEKKKTKLLTRESFES